jgi:hypothetical protein
MAGNHNLEGNQSFESQESKISKSDNVNFSDVMGRNADVARVNEATITRSEQVKPEDLAAINTQLGKFANNQINFEKV